MNIFILQRDTAIKQIVQNMVEAGVVKAEEDKQYTAQLQQLDPKDLLATLVESHMIREQMNGSISYYPIDYKAISSN